MTLIALAEPSEGFSLVPVAVALIPAVAAVVAAVLSARSAREARAGEVEAQRVRSLEERLAEKKYDVYRPMLIQLQSVLDSKGKNLGIKEQAAFQKNVSDFWTWLSIFGSDEALRAFHNWMQAAFHDAPAAVYLRLYSDFVLAARRDMGDQDTTATHAEILGGRITDLYSVDSAMLRNLTLPFDEVCSEHNWEIPWRRVPNVVSKSEN